jgi:hypothetical protein
MLPNCEKCGHSLRFRARVIIVTNIRRRKKSVRGYHLSCARSLDFQAMTIGGLFAVLPKKKKEKSNKNNNPA